jgi:cobalt-zinc-cadmium efflux system outer membrane protein
MELYAHADAGHNGFRLSVRLTLQCAASVAVVLCLGVAEGRGDVMANLYDDGQPQNAAAQPPEILPPVDASPGLTLAELEQMALAANPSIARAAAMIGAARGNWVQVGLLPNPSVGYEGQQLGSGGQAEQHGVLFSQEIVRGGKLELNRMVAQREIQILEQELAAQQMRVLTDVRVAFYQVLVADQQIELADNLIRISGEGSRAVDALFQAKEVGRADVLQAQLEVENARILSQNARNRREATWRNLAAVVGNPALASEPLVGDSTAPPMEVDFQQALARIHQASPEVAAAAARVDRARAVLRRACAEVVPNVNFEGLVNWQDNGIGGKPDGGVAVTMPLPIFNRNQGAIRRAQQELTAAQRALDQLELDLQSRLAPTFERLANARNQVKRYRELILPAAQESLLLTRTMYEAGESNYIGLLTAQRTFSQTGWNYLDAVLALRIAEAEIDGFLLRGSLQEPASLSRIP